MEEYSELSRITVGWILPLYDPFLLPVVIARMIQNVEVLAVTLKLCIIVSRKHAMKFEVP